MIILINWLNHYVTIYRYMKMTYHNHDMEDYIDYHDIRYTIYIAHHYTPFTKVCQYIKLQLNLVVIPVRSFQSECPII